MENYFILNYIDILNEMMDIDDDDRQETNCLPVMSVEGVIETYNCEIGDILLEADNKNDEKNGDDKSEEKIKKTESKMKKVAGKFIKYISILVNKIREYYKKLKNYIRNKIEELTYGTKYESGSTKKSVNENAAPLVRKDFDYASGIRKLYSFLVPFVDGFSNYTGTLRGISIEKISKSMGTYNRYTKTVEGEAIKGDRSGVIRKYFAPLVEKDPAMICTNDEYKSSEDVQTHIREIEHSFFGPTDKKVSIDEYKYTNPIDNVKEELDKFLSNIDKIQKSAEKACSVTEQYVKTMITDTNRTLFVERMFDPTKAGLIEGFLVLCKRALDKLAAALSFQTSIMSPLTRVLERATKEQLVVNRALKFKKEEYVPPVNKKPLQLAAPRESVNIDYLYESIGESYELLCESKSRDRMVMLIRKCQIICQKIIMFIDKASTTMVQYAQKLIIKYTTIMSRLLDKNFKEQIAAGENRSRVIGIPSVALSKAMEICTDVMSKVVLNIQEFAMVDVESDKVKTREFKEITPMSIALYKMDERSIGEIVDKLNKKLEFKEKVVYINDQALLDKIALISGRELESSIKFIKNIEKEMKRKLDKVLSDITKKSKNKNLSNEGYNYCVRIVTACSIAFSVVQKCTHIMYKQFIKCNSAFQVINSTYNEYDKAGAQKYNEKREKEERERGRTYSGGATTESFNDYEYKRWIRDKMIKKYNYIL
jgi:hypothetical protein